MPPAEPVEVFISYAQEDEGLCEELEKHLKTLQREKAIASWHDRKIVAGTELKDEIDRHLNRAGIILLLVSPDFIASDYHWTIEVTRALERNASGKARVIPVLLRSTEWKMPPIDKLSALPKNGKPVKGSYWSDRDEAFLEIVTGIREEVARLTANPGYSPPQQNASLKEILTLKPASEKPEAQPGNIGSDDLTLELILSLGEFTYGVEKRIALQDGAITVTVPPGLSPGKKLRLREKGKLNQLTQRRGDLFLKLLVAKHASSAPEDYQRKLRQYEQELTRAIQLKFPLSEYSQEGLKQYQQTLDLRDEDVLLVEERVTTQESEKREHQATIFVNEAEKLFDQGKFEEAVPKYKKALQYNPKNVNAYIGLGAALQNQGKFDEAIAANHKAIQVDPNMAISHINLGTALASQGKLDEAIATYHKAIQVDPNMAHAYFILGTVLSNQGKLDEAIAAYHKFIQIGLDKENGYCALGHVLAAQGKLDEAIAAYHKAIQIDPNMAVAYNNLGHVLSVQGKLDEAIAACRKAIQIDPSDANTYNANTYNALGVYLQIQEKLDEAIAAYRKAIQIDPNDANTYQNLGIALDAQGKREEANEAYQKAKQLGFKRKKFLGIF